MKKAIVIFKKEKTGEIVAFLPESAAHKGNIVCYTMSGRMIEVDYRHYKELQNANEQEYMHLFKELCHLYRAHKLVVNKKFANKTLEKSWIL